MEERNGGSFYFHDEITFYYAKLLLRIQLVFEFCKKHPFTLGAAVEECPGRNELLYGRF